MKVDEMIKRLEEKADHRFDPFFAFLKKEGIAKKLSRHDMNKIFLYFKENWRADPEFDCSKAGLTSDGKCTAYQVSEIDDEPHDRCKGCPKSQFFEDEQEG